MAFFSVTQKGHVARSPERSTSDQNPFALFIYTLIDDDSPNMSKIGGIRVGKCAILTWNHPSGVRPHRQSVGVASAAGATCVNGLPCDKSTVVLPCALPWGDKEANRFLWVNHGSCSGSDNPFEGFK